MHQQSWQDLWGMFLAVMASEPIHIRLVIGMALAFLAVMSLTGIADSFLPRRAARRYAAMYDMMPAIGAAPAQQSYAVPPPPPAEEPAVAPDAPDEPDEPNGGGDMRYAAEGGVNFSAPRRSAPPPPKVLRAQKP